MLMNALMSFSIPVTLKPKLSVLIQMVASYVIVLKASLETDITAQVFELSLVHSACVWTNESTFCYKREPETFLIYLPNFVAVPLYYRY